MHALNHRRPVVQTSQAPDNLARLVLGGADQSLDGEAVQAVNPSLAHPDQRPQKGRLLNQQHRLPAPRIQDLQSALQPDPRRRYPLLPKRTPPDPAKRTPRFTLTDPALTDHPVAVWTGGVSGIGYRGRLHG